MAERCNNTRVFTVHFLRGENFVHSYLLSLSLQLMNGTIHKDIEEADKKIVELISKLSSERMIQIKKKVTYPASLP